MRIEDPEKLASHLRTSLIERLERLVDAEKAAASSAPQPLSPPPVPQSPPQPQPKLPSPPVPPLSAAEKKASLDRGILAVEAVALLLYGPRQGQEQKLAAVIAGETLRQAAMDLADWAPRSTQIVQAVVSAAGLDKTAGAGAKRAVADDYVGRLLAHGLMARANGY